MTHVLLFIPNIIGYIRFILGVIAFINFNHPICFISSYGLSYFLDWTDGWFARRYNQCSEFGAMLDMITDRLCTITLLIMLSHQYPAYMAYFLFMAVLDMTSHWLQTTSCKMAGAASHKGNSDEPFLVSLYYKVPYLLLVCVAGAEIYILMIYLHAFYPSMSRCICCKIIFVLSALIFHFKQAINVAQLMGSVKRLIKISEDERAKAKQ
jgi:CDP-diacylglycerol--inositol 3-phosphatidyltransferase